MVIDVESENLKEGQSEGKKFFVYLLLCADDSLYCGSTSDLNDRVEAHNAGDGAVWTKTRRPVKLAYSEVYDTLLAARRREKQIKGWTVRKKMNLICGRWGKVD